VRPPARAPRRAGPFAALVAGSAALHAMAVASVLLWPGGRPLEEPPAGEGVALVFADVAALAAAAPAEGEPEAGMPAAPPAPPPPAARPAPPPEPEQRFAEAPPLPVPPPLPDMPAVAPPDAPGLVLPPGSVAADEPPHDAPQRQAEAEPLAAPPPQPGPPIQAPPPRAVVQATPPRPQQAPRGGGVNLDAGIAAMGDARLGAEAIGAVVPPTAEAGQRNEPPDYPAESRRRGEEGTVRLSLRIGPDGRVQMAEVAQTSGHPALDRAAVEAVRRWRFRPATQAGLPVAASMQTAVHFRLTEERRR